MKKLWIYSVFFIFSSTAMAKEISLLSWNVYMLPKPIKFSKQIERTKGITEVLKGSEYDVILLQETFSSRFSGTIINELSGEYPHHLRLGRSGWWKQIMNSGLLILSKHPLKPLGFTYFDLCVGFDCYSSKGILLTEVLLPDGKKFQIANAHLQSGQNELKRETRQYQLEMIKDLLSQHDENGIAQILAGDLNVNALSGDEFTSMLNYLEMTSGPLLGEIQSTSASATECFGKKYKGKKQWLDHFVVKSNASSYKEVRKTITPLRSSIKGQICDLSDHHPIEVRFTI